jgi:hypothetical protein
MRPLTPLPRGLAARAAGGALQLHSQAGGRQAGGRQAGAVGGSAAGRLRALASGAARLLAGADRRERGSLHSSWGAARRRLAASRAQPLRALTATRRPTTARRRRRRRCGGWVGVAST